MVGTYHFHLGYAGEEVVPAVLHLFAAATGAQLLQFFEHAAILGHKALAYLQAVHEAIAGLALIVLVQGLVEVGVGTGAGCWIVQVVIQCFLHLGGKDALAHERQQHVAELGLPLLAMGAVVVRIVYGGEHMRQLVYQRYQEAVGVKVGIDAHAVVGLAGHGLPVVAQHALALVREGEVHGMVAKVGRHHMEGVGRQKELEVAE